MTLEPKLENEADLSQRMDSEPQIEQKNELKEAQIDQGAQMLENPPDGSFLHGLQAFVAWVKGLVGKDD